MTSELEYYGEPEAEHDPSELWAAGYEASQQTERGILEPAKPTNGHPRLLDGDLWRVLENDGVDGVAHFAMYALHESEEHLAYPSDLTVARLCDLRDQRTVERRNAKFVERGIFEPATTKKGKPAMRVLHCDGSQEFTPLIRQFIEDYVAPHADLRTMEVPEWVPDGPDKVWVGPKPRKKHRYVRLHHIRDGVTAGLGITGLGMYYSMVTVARMRMGVKPWNGRFVFVTSVENLCGLLHVSRSRFDRVRPILESFGLLETTQAGRSVRWAVVVQGAWGANDGKSSSKMRGSPEIVIENAEQAEKSSSKMLHEVDLLLEVDLNPEEHQNPKQDQRSAENRALAAAPEPVASPSQDQEPPATVETVEACTARMLAKLGIKLTTPPEPQPKVKSAVQLLREQGWIITSDTVDGWPCAEKPGEHDCCHGLIFARNGRGHESTLRCKVCFDAARMQVVHEQDAEPAATNSGFLEMFIPKLTPPRLPAQRQLTAVPPTIEAECSERKAPKPERDVGDILPPEKLRDYLKWTEVVTDRTMNPGLRTRVTRMFRYGGVARYSAEDYREKLVEVRHEKWELKHGHCHNFGRDPCDGSCGHDQDECDGHVVNLTDAGVLDLVGCAIYSLTGDEHYGRSDDNGCPNAVRERMYAA